jgi:hypothetical protein
MATKTLQSAIFTRIFLVTALAGITAAITHSRDVLIPVVGTGIIVSVASILWHWRQRPYAGEIRVILSADTVLIYIVLIPGALFILVVASWLLYTLYAQTRVSCICLGQDGGSSLLNIALGSGAVTLFGMVSLLNLCLGVGALRGFRIRNV